MGTGVTSIELGSCEWKWVWFGYYLLLDQLKTKTVSEWEEKCVAKKCGGGWEN